MVFSTVSPGRLNTRDMLIITQHTSYSDWLFLYYLAKNMESYVFQNLLSDLSNELRHNDYNDNDEVVLRKPFLGKYIIKEPIIEEKPTHEMMESIDEVDFKKA